MCTQTGKGEGPSGRVGAKAKAKKGFKKEKEKKGIGKTRAGETRKNALNVDKNRQDNP